MAITLIENQAVKFNAVGTPDFNTLGNNCGLHHDYCNPIQCDDVTNFEVNINPVTGNELVEGGDMIPDSETGNPTLIVGNHLIDTSGVDFVAAGVIAGFRVLNSTTGAEAKVVSVTPTDLLLDVNIFNNLAHVYKVSWWWLEGDAPITVQGWQIFFNQAIGIGEVAAPNNMYQDILTIGKFYKVTFDLQVLNTSANQNLKVFLGDDTNTEILSLDETDELKTYTAFGFAEVGDNLIFQIGQGSSVNLSNVSVIEYTQAAYTVTDCDTGEVVFSDFENNTIAYSTLTDTALISFDWSSLACNDGCFKINLIDLTDIDLNLITTFFSDALTDANGTLIENHIPTGIGTSWSFTGSGGVIMTIQSNTLSAEFGVTSDCFALPNATYTSANQCAQFNMSNVAATTSSTSTFWLRGDGNAVIPFNAYGIEFSPDSSSAPNDASIQLFKTDGVGVKTALSSPVLYVEGGIRFILFCVIDDVIMVLLDGVEIILTTDSDNSNIGKPQITYEDQIFPEPAPIYDNVAISELEIVPNFTSECYNLQEVAPCTLLLSANNNDNAFGLDYTGLAYTQFLRVPGCIGKDKFPGALDPLLNSSGVKNVIYAQSRTVRETTINAVPLYVHTAIRLFRIHDNFTVDGVLFTPTSPAHNPDWENEDDLAPVEFDLEVKSEDNVNTNCN